MPFRVVPASGSSLNNRSQSGTRWKRKVSSFKMTSCKRMRRSRVHDQRVEEDPRLPGGCGRGAQPSSNGTTRSTRGARKSWAVLGHRTLKKLTVKKHLLELLMARGRRLVASGFPRVSRPRVCVQDSVQCLPHVPNGVQMNLKGPRAP